MNIAPEVAAYVKDVRDNDTATNWATFGLEGQSVCGRAKGTSGRAELLRRFTSDVVCYALLRTTSGDNESRRTKFVLITWVGREASVIARGRAPALKDNLLPIVGSFHIEITTDDAADLSEEAICRRLKAAGGADYDAGSTAVGHGEGARKIKARAMSKFEGITQNTAAEPSRKGSGGTTKITTSAASPSRKANYAAAKVTGPTVSPSRKSSSETARGAASTTPVAPVQRRAATRSSASANGAALPFAAARDVFENAAAPKTDRRGASAFELAKAKFDRRVSAEAHNSRKTTNPTESANAKSSSTRTTNGTGSQPATHSAPNQHPASSTSTQPAAFATDKKRASSGTGTTAAASANVFANAREKFAAMTAAGNGGDSPQKARATVHGDSSATAQKGAPASVAPGADGTTVATLASETPTAAESVADGETQRLADREGAADGHCGDDGKEGGEAAVGEDNSGDVSVESYAVPA